MSLTDYFSEYLIYMKEFHNLKPKDCMKIDEVEPYWERNVPIEDLVKQTA